MHKCTYMHTHTHTHTHARTHTLKCPTPPRRCLYILHCEYTYIHTASARRTIQQSHMSHHHTHMSHHHTHMSHHHTHTSNLIIHADDAAKNGSNVPDNARHNTHERQRDPKCSPPAQKVRGGHGRCMIFSPRNSQKSVPWYNFHTNTL